MKVLIRLHGDEVGTWCDAAMTMEEFTKIVAVGMLPEMDVAFKGKILIALYEPGEDQYFDFVAKKLGPYAENVKLSYDEKLIILTSLGEAPRKQIVQLMDRAVNCWQDVPDWALAIYDMLHSNKPY
jgi:hypothetical protein